MYTVGEAVGEMEGGRDREGGLVTEWVRLRVGEVDGESVELGQKLPDWDPLGLHVGGTMMPVVWQALQVQGMGVERPGVGQ